MLRGQNKKDYQKKYMERKRSNNVRPIEIVDPNVRPLPAIVYALTDPIKRRKLEKICQSLKDFNQLGEVGYGVEGPTFDIVGELLEVTG